MIISRNAGTAGGKFFLVVMTLLCATHTPAQTTERIRDPFMKLMLAYPGNFVSVSKGAYDSLWSKYESIVYIPGTYGNQIRRKHRNTERYFEASVDIPDSYSGEQYEMVFNKWTAAISGLSFNGATLREISDPRYSEKNSWFIRAKAWQLDRSKFELSPDYVEFTIRLELLNLDEGGWHLGILVGHRKIDPRY